MKKLYTILTVLFLLINNVPFPIIAVASNEVSESRKIENVEKIRNGKKLNLNETVSESDYNNDKFVVFVKKDSYEKSKKNVAKNNGVFSSVDTNVYGKVMAIPVDLTHMSDSQKKKFLEDIDVSGDTVAIASVHKRTLAAVPTFNDPLYPTDLTYDSAKQWYLSQPSSGKYGIDVQRAWEFLDSLGKTYNGSSSVTIAVIDTGAAFENYSKYDQYTLPNKMVNPSPWVFSLGTDFSSNLFNNSSETADNQIDDDSKGEELFCIDRNSDGDCDTGEASMYIDDKNGFNVLDWGKYWSRVTYNEYTSAPVCTNEPYFSDGVKCVSTYSNESLCSQNGLDNYLYYGCFESDMGHPNDVHGHGTLVSNIISSKANNGISGVGIASGVNILPIKVFGEEYNDYRSKWVFDSAYGDQIANSVNYAVAMGADIINLSLAGSTVDYYEKLAIDSAYYDHDVLVVAASGNSGTSTTNYPAGYDSVLSVGASSKTGLRASYSSYGSTIDLVAPVDTGIPTQGLWDTINNKDVVASCSWDSSLECLNVDPTADPSEFGSADMLIAGTSFAAPQVAAVAGLIKSVYPELSAKQLAYILKMSSSSAGSLSYNSYIGNGILNAYNAVRAKEYRGHELSEIKRMYQTSINSNGYMYTRYSDTFGASWTGWIKSGTVKSVGGLITQRIPLSNEKVVQVMRGTNSGVYVRRADDFGYIGSSDSAWSSWSLIGYSSGAIYSVKSGNNIVLSWKGTNGRLYTYYTSDGITWSAVSSSTQYASGSVQMVVDIATQKVLQAIRSTSGYIYTRTSSDNGATWTSWIKSSDVFASDPQLFAVTGKIFRVGRNSDDVIITRYSTDGGTTWSGRNRTYGSSGLSTSGVSMLEVSEKGTLSQSWKATNNNIYSRYSTNGGASWTTQVLGYDFSSSITPATTPVSINAWGNIIQTVRASNSYMYYRRSTDGGKTWSTWRNTGSIKILGNPYMWYESEMDRVFITVRDLNGYVNTRTSDNQGSTYSAWYKSGTTTSGIRTDSTTMETLDLSIP